MSPDDGARSCGPLPESDAAGHPEPRAKPEELRCVPSSEAAGQACGPRARAARRSRPRIIEALTRARDWQRMIDAGEVKNAAQIARDHNVTRARVSQVMTLLRLAPEIVEYIDDLDGSEGCLHLTERKVRAIALLEDHAAQRAAFGKLVGVTIPPRAPTSPRVAPRAARSRQAGLAAEAGA